MTSLNPEDRLLPPDGGRCPSSIRILVDKYISDRSDPGGFVRACLANDLRAAILLAGRFNILYITHIVEYINENVPSNLRGSYASVMSTVASTAEVQVA